MDDCEVCINSPPLGIVLTFVIDLDRISVRRSLVLEVMDTDFGQMPKLRAEAILVGWGT